MMKLPRVASESGVARGKHGSWRARRVLRGSRLPFTFPFPPLPSALFFGALFSAHGSTPQLMSILAKVLNNSDAYVLVSVLLL